MSLPVRPWGSCSWVYSLLNEQDWDFVGCLGTEARSLSAWSNPPGALPWNSTLLLRISDPGTRFAALSSERLSERFATYLSMGGDSKSISDHNLLEAAYLLEEELGRFLQGSKSNVILDMTSLPKRFFFPAIKTLLRFQSPRLSNILLTYARPLRYNMGRLAENYSNWDHLPSFSGKYNPRDGRPNILIVSIGFEELGLHEHLMKLNPDERVRLLLPFPAPVQRYQRTWELLRKLEKGRSKDTFEIHRVGANDVSDAFDTILRITGGGEKLSILAPFGPKPVSAAICIFAELTGSAVFYTQPTAYHPDYSIGESIVNGKPEVFAYCIRVGGRDLYSLPE